MSEEIHNLNPSTSSSGPLVPESILTANRWELTKLELTISEGKLPSDIHGHVFLIAPVGTVNSGGLPFPNGQSFFNGDGMIYRLDFDQQGQVTITTRLVKPPDYYADRATRPGTDYEKYQFRNHGITRFSFILGFRNELNTAFLLMPSRKNNKNSEDNENSLDRLLVTYDGGRPYELDTETLEIVTPIGSNQEWKAEINKPIFPFKPILSTAHPAFDVNKGEMFTVNYGRSIFNLLQTLPVLLALEKLPDAIYHLIASIIGFAGANTLRSILRENLRWTQSLTKEVIQIIQKLIGEDIADFVYLIRWDGQGNLERWNLRLPDGSPVRIEQTIHQIGITKDYVILMDTGFIMGVKQVFNNLFPENDEAARILRQLLERPNLPDSHIYIVRRSDLEAGQFPACSEEEVTVLAKKLTIPLSTAHFLVDYENPEGQITLHAAHICAWNVADGVRKYDLSAYPPHDPISDRIYSMEPNEMDISRLGRYVIDGRTGKLVQSKVIHDSPSTWGLALFAYRDRLTSGMPPKRLDNIYWNSFGLWHEIMTNFALELYEDYPYRAIPVEDVLNLAKKGVPSHLIRLHTPSMTIADCYHFPDGHIGTSPQFIPRTSSKEDSTDDSTHGYIICTVFTPHGSEFWIFDGANFGQKPLCKLSHPSLRFGYSLHTAWLPKIGGCQSSYNIPVKPDFHKLIAEQSPEIQQFFDKEVYPNFQRDSQK